MKSSKIPATVANDFFSDSPLRSTAPKPAPEPSRSRSKTPRTPPKEVNEITDVDEPSSESLGADEIADMNQIEALPLAIETHTPPAPSPVPAPVQRPGAKQTKASETPVQSELIKLTVYLEKPHFDELEEEVYRRRRAGLRVRNNDLFREIIQEWCARKTRNTP